jgi:hypothetical protein
LIDVSEFLPTTTYTSRFVKTKRLLLLKANEVSLEQLPYYWKFPKAAAENQGLSARCLYREARSHKTAFARVKLSGICAGKLARLASTQLQLNIHADAI